MEFGLTHIVRMSTMSCDTRLGKHLPMKELGAFAIGFLACASLATAVDVLAYSGAEDVSTSEALALFIYAGIACCIIGTAVFGASRSISRRHSSLPLCSSYGAIAVLIAVATTVATHHVAAGLQPWPFVSSMAIASAVAPWLGAKGAPSRAG